MYLYRAENDLLVCDLTMEDIVDAEKEFASYMRKEGRIYDLDDHKEPSVNRFFKLYFGERDYDIYVGETFETPDRYVCPDGESAKRFMWFAKKLRYHDRLNQTYCDVVMEEDGKTISVIYGDY
jgi:hypothetical protein